MSGESEPPPSLEEQQLSKKAAKKQATKEETMRRHEEQALNPAAAALLSVDEEDPRSHNYGDVLLSELQSSSDPEAGNWSRVINGRDWIELGSLNQELKDKEVLIRRRVHMTRPVSKKMVFLVVREKGVTVQCLATMKLRESAPKWSNLSLG